MTLLNASGLLLIALSQPTDAPEAQPVPAVSTLDPALTVVQDEEAAPEEETEPNWDGSVNLGATWSNGNTEVVTVSLAIDAELKREKDRQTITGWWNYGSDQNAIGSTITQRNAGAIYKYDYFLNEKTFLFAIAGAETDTLAMLDLRWYAGGGVGHQFADEEDWKLSGEVGVTYFDEDFEVDTDDADYVAARLAYSLYKRLTETTVLEADGQIFPSLEDGDDIYARHDTRLKFDVTENMFAQLQWIYKWDNTPASGAERVDNQLIATLGWGF